MVRAYVIVNPIAGAGKTFKLWPNIKDQLDRVGLDFKFKMTDAKGHAIELAEQAVKDGWQFIVSVGGDGTINEIVNGLYNVGGLHNVILGIISTGTGADYIRTIDIPRSYNKACSLFINPKVRNVDLGIIEWNEDNINKKRVFVNFAGLGFDAEIVKSTTQKYKAFGKVSAYLLALFTTLVFYENKNVSILIDNIEEKKKVCTIIMGNGKYGGGGMMTTPEASIEDNLLDVLIVGDLDKFDLIRSLPRIYNGTHLSHPKVSLKKVNKIEIRTEKKLSIQADGDIVAESPATFKILDKKLKVVV